MASQSPTVRRLVASAGGHALHASHNTLTVSEPGRRKIEQNFLDRVLAEAAARGETLTDEEAQKRARHARKSHMKLLSAKAAAKRKRVS